MASDIHSFLGLVCYLTVFLPNLAKFTSVLDELTKKEHNKKFLGWTSHHQTAFKGTKKLVTSTACLTTIDPKLMPEYKIFVTTDASDTRLGGILSFGPSYKLAKLVAYDSCTFKGAKLNYLVHEKEMLVIICALGKWCMDLLGYCFEIWTNHRTLEHFNSQKDLSCCQACWIKFLSQYDVSINYIPGDKNCATDTLSQLPDSSLRVVATIFTSSNTHSSHSQLELDTEMLSRIKGGYRSDPFILKLTSASAGMDAIQNKNSFWFINQQLIIPNVKKVWESPFQLAHDSLVQTSLLW